MRKVTLNIQIRTTITLDDDVTMGEIKDSITGLGYSEDSDLSGRMTVEDETVESFEVEDSR